MFVFIPPLVMLAPATLAGFMQFPPLVIRLPAIAPVMLNGFMQIVLGMRDSPLAMLLGFRMRLWHHGNQQGYRQSRQSQQPRSHPHLFCLLAIHAHSSVCFAFIIPGAISLAPARNYRMPIGWGIL